MRLGILGGAFNPPHVGHLVCAQEAFSQLGLDRVILIPVGEPPHRGLEDDPGGEARLEMTALAVDGDDRLGVSRIELDREGASYTVDTLRELREQGSDDELFVILGGDQAADLPTWHQPEEVLKLASVAVVERVGWSRNTIGIKLAGLRPADRVRFIDMPLMQVSSSAIRHRVADGRPIRYLVPDRVASYIEANRLYGAGQPAGASR